MSPPQLNLTPPNENVLFLSNSVFPTMDHGQNIPSRPINKLGEKAPQALALGESEFLRRPQGV